jgi:hypothetical protein
MAVEPTRSQNITVIGRRSAETSGVLGRTAGLSGEGDGVANSAIAASSLRRSPTVAMPISLRSSAVT